MKKVFTLLAALLIGNSIKAQYFCTENQTELQYVNYDEAGQSTSSETMTVLNGKADGNGSRAQYLTKIVTNKAKNNTSYTLYNWSYDGEQTVCQEDLIYGPYIKSDSDPSKYSLQVRKDFAADLKYKGDNTFMIGDEAQAGESMPNRSYSLITSMLKHDVQISGASYMGYEKVSTTAGKFDCIKISYLQRTKILLKSETLRITEWYAKGIGLVKSEAYDMKGEPHSKKLLVKIFR